MTSRLTMERDFYRERSLRADWTWVGASSQAMLRVAVDGGEPDMWPMDRGDLNRCEETYRRAPDHLRERMLTTLERFRAHVEARYAG